MRYRDLLEDGDEEVYGDPIWDDIHSLTQLALSLGVDLHATPHEDRISLIGLYRTTGKPGAGALVMDKLCALADKYELEITLDAEGGSQGIFNYYRRWGFELEDHVVKDMDEDGDGFNGPWLMYRLPRPQTTGGAITEVFQVAPFRWLEKSDQRWRATFKARGEPYIVAFMNIGNGVWGCGMARSHSKSEHLIPSPDLKEFFIRPRSEDVGVAGKVFGTTFAITSEFLKEARPSCLAFQGSTDSRDKLYKAFARRSAQDLADIGYAFKGDGIYRIDPLNEAPIADVTLMGDPRHEENPNASFDQGTGFSQSDKRLLTNHKAINKIVRAFQKTPHVFEVFFANTDTVDGDSDGDNEDVDKHARHLGAGIYDSFGIIPGKLGVIRIVLLANLSPSSQDKMPMTAWTLAHKIGHSIQDEITKQTQWSDQKKTELHVRIKAINKLIWRIGTRYKGDDHISTAFSYPEGLEYIMTMKSARDGKASNPFEQFAELIAQYLIVGAVKFKFEAPDAAEVLPMVDQLNREIKDLFDSFKGKVLVEV